MIGLEFDDAWCDHVEEILDFGILSADRACSFPVFFHGFILLLYSPAGGISAVVLCSGRYALFPAVDIEIINAH